jgi:acetyl/propionyl-CoA carboxylase alpha subunit
MLKRILIANRGEIARRIARTCRRLGVEYVTVFSDADARSPHLEGSVRTVALGDSAPVESYLNTAKLIEAAQSTGCDGIHPGYGFVSENADFAQAVLDAGLIFIGPRPETIRSLGDKARAKAIMAAAEVPTVPGTAEASDDVKRITELARGVGYPLLLKPSAGGGGKGMQIVTDAEQLLNSARAGMRVAKANFNDARLIVERYVDSPRHIEVQVFGDQHGKVVHLFERECSLQRRHQKVIEEAPAIALDPEVRQALLDSAVRGASAIGYVNAGTFEYIVDKDQRFYFLEVNTRLQVEHPVTEAITGLDLVEWQLRVASGEKLPLEQKEIHASGHAVECRLYAEDPTREFRPSPGTAVHVRWPAAARTDAGIVSGGEVSPFYDPMIAKLIVHGLDRTEALTRARAAVRDTAVLGLTTNLGFLTNVLDDAEVAAGHVHTRYLDEHLARLGALPSSSGAIACAAAIELEKTRSEGPAWPWGTAGGATPFGRADLVATAPHGAPRFWSDDRQVAAAIQSTAADGVVHSVVEGQPHRVQVRRDGGSWVGTVDEAACHAIETADGYELAVGGQRFTLQTLSGRAATSGGDAGTAAAPMPGVLVALPVAVGDRVKAGTVVAVVEAMKMENSVLAPTDGVVQEIHRALGAMVKAGEVLVSVQADPNGAPPAAAMNSGAPP